jgi:hypothetical protein
LSLGRDLAGLWPLESTSKRGWAPGPYCLWSPQLCAHRPGSVFEPGVAIRDGMVTVIRF